MPACFRRQASSPAVHLPRSKVHHHYHYCLVPTLPTRAFSHDGVVHYWHSDGCSAGGGDKAAFKEEDEVQRSHLCWMMEKCVLTGSSGNLSRQWACVSLLMKWGSTKKSFGSYYG